MAKKMNQYRVELFNDYTPIEGMQSDFAKHPDLESARRWAIERGKKGGAEYVMLFIKNENRYNHYNYLAKIDL